MNQYLKFASQVIATVLAAVSAALAGDGNVDTSEAVNILILALGAVAVLGAGNLPAGVWAHTKLFVSGATAGAVFLQSVLTDGVSPAEWFQLVVAVLGSIGVAAVKGPLVEKIGRHAADQ